MIYMETHIDPYTYPVTNITGLVPDPIGVDWATLATAGWIADAAELDVVAEETDDDHTNTDGSYCGRIAVTDGPATPHGLYDLYADRRLGLVFAVEVTA